VVGNDFSQFVLDVLRINGLATDDREILGCEIEFALLDVVTGRLS